MPVRYKKILLPLDGSKVAVVAVGDAVAVAEARLAVLTMLQIVAPISDVLPIDGYAMPIDERFDLRHAKGAPVPHARSHRARRGTTCRFG
jgi:nucleotide-binding universal stress UspA family protein